jgi:hypothetical protein
MQEPPTVVVLQPLQAGNAMTAVYSIFLGIMGQWWVDNNGTVYDWVISIDKMRVNLYRTSEKYQFGYSVRCVKY